MPSWRPGWPSWVLEDVESPRDAPWPPRDPREEGGCMQQSVGRGVPCQTALGILPRLNVPGGTVADDGKRLWRAPLVLGLNFL